MKVATVINYSSLDNQFIQHAVDQSRIFSDAVILASYNKFFDGTNDKDILNIDSADMHVWLDYDESKTARWHHNNARYKGYEAVMSFRDVDYVLFLDGDEVPDGKAMRKWLKEGFTKKDSKIANWWYIKTSEYRGNFIEDSATLVKTPIAEDRFWHDSERHGLSNSWLRYQGDSALIHHYSWAKSEAILRKKVATWGHKNDGVDWNKYLDIILDPEWNITIPWDRTKQIVNVKSFI